MDKKNEKKFIQSPVAVACYVIAALMLIYACYQGGSTVGQINEYYAGYGMSAKPMEYVTYVFQAMLEPVFHAIVIFMAGYILNAVRKLDPKNFKTAAELAEMQEAKRVAKEKKQVAKGDVKAEKAGHAVSKEASVRADFAESLDAELKSEVKPVKSGSRKSGQSGQSRSKNSQSKSGSKSSSKSGNSGTRRKSAPKKTEKAGEVKEAKEAKEVKESKKDNEGFSANVNESQESDN